MYLLLKRGKFAIQMHEILHECQKPAGTTVHGGSDCVLSRTTVLIVACELVPFAENVIVFIELISVYLVVW